MNETAQSVHELIQVQSPLFESTRQLKMHEPFVPFSSRMFAHGWLLFEHWMGTISLSRFTRKPNCRNSNMSRNCNNKKSAHCACCSSHVTNTIRLVYRTWSSHTLSIHCEKHLTSSTKRDCYLAGALFVSAIDCHITRGCLRADCHITRGCLRAVVFLLLLFIGPFLLMHHRKKKLKTMGNKRMKMV